MKAEINLKSFVVAVAYLVLAGALACGFIQDVIKFNSVDSEIFMFLLCSSSGLLCLIASIKIKR
jgi:amino acid permease